MNKQSQQASKMVQRSKVYRRGQCVSLSSGNRRGALIRGRVGAEVGCELDGFPLLKSLRWALEVDHYTLQKQVVIEAIVETKGTTVTVQVQHAVQRTTANPRTVARIALRLLHRFGPMFGSIGGK